MKMQTREARIFGIKNITSISRLFLDHRGNQEKPYSWSIQLYVPMIIEAIKEFGFETLIKQTSLDGILTDFQWKCQLKKQGFGIKNKNLTCITSYLIIEANQVKPFSWSIQLYDPMKHHL